MRRSVGLRMAMMAAIAAGIENRRENRRIASVMTAKELIARQAAEADTIAKAEAKRARKAARRQSQKP